MNTPASLLRQVPDTYTDLAHALVPGGGGSDDSDRVSGGGNVHQPAPANLQVAEHRHQLLRGLRWWVDAVRDEDDTARVGESVTSMCVWLLDHLDVMAPEDHDQLADNLATWLHQARKHLTSDGPTRRVPLPAGCLASTELWGCPGELHLAIPAKGRTRPYLGCPECRGRWHVTELPAAANVTLPVHVAAELLDVDVSTIKRRAPRTGGMVKLGDALRTPCAL